MNSNKITYFFISILSTVVHADLSTTILEATIACDENITCNIDENITSTTESLSLVTDIESGTEKNVSVNITYKNPAKRRDFNKENICLCDLKLNSCDINCCCDHDCTFDQKLIFSHCEAIQRHYDRYYCYSTNIIYINNTPFAWERSNYGLFCIVRENLPTHHIVQVKEPIQKLQTAKDLTENKYTWPGIPQRQEEFNGKSFLKYGDNILIKRKNSDIEILSIPKNFLSTSCITNHEIKFLNDFSATCTQVLDENNPDLNAATFYDNITILSFSVLQNNTSLEDYLHICPKNMCLPIQTFLCNDKLDTCVKINGNRTLHRISCELNVTTKDKTCFYVVKRVKYEFFHNGTYGLMKINLYLHLTSATQFLDDYYYRFIQNFDVKFLWYDSVLENNFSTILSGNPGYIIGKPILFSKLISKVKNITDSITIEKEFLKNDTDFTKNFLVLPKNVEGLCVFNNQNFEAIEFGYNSEYFCTQKFGLNKTINASQICVKLQKELLSNWGINIHNNTKSDMYVGMFGNANRSQISEWIEILYDFDSEIFETHTGLYKDNVLVCNNFAKSVKINILYTSIDFKDIRNQAKILNVFFDLEITKSVDLVIKNCKNQICDTYLNTETKVMFFDVTYKKSNKFQDPRLHLTLPQDLFYPFMAGSRSCIFDKNTFYIIIITTNIFLFY